MSRRNTVRIVSFSLSITLCFAIFAFKTKKENAKYVLELENSYSHNFDELNTAADNMATLLNKARFVTSPEKLGEIAAELLAEAQLCKSSLSQLPVSGELAGLNRFFSQVGNYALAVSKHLEENTELSMSHTANIEKLSIVSRNVAGILLSSKEDFNNLEYWARELESKIDSASNDSLTASLAGIEEEFNDYPTLIYDGPYSDHILNKESALLQNTATVSQENALRTAALTANIPFESLDYAGTSQGKISTLDFLGEGISVSITQKGGFPLYMRKEIEISEIKLDYSYMLSVAYEFLNKIGFTRMKETYYFEENGICTINFAFLQGDTLCYTDLLKVGVSMEDGEVVFFESGGYIANHRERSLSEPKCSLEQAQAFISPKLTVESSRLCLIPTNATEEKHCYEFTCISADNQEIAVYINASTLKEEEILILIKSDGGVLVK